MRNVRTNLSGARGRAVGLLLGFSILAPAIGQSPASPQDPLLAAKTAPEVSTHDATPTFGTRVKLVPVRVVVRDLNGKAVGDLRREDFQLFDRGKAQVISRFSVEKAGGTGAVISSASAGPDDATESKDPKAPWRSPDEKGVELTRIGVWAFS
jgi:hypothetical protein